MPTSSINSITLSPDLTTLYLIDNGRAISFDLKHKNGIVIGTLDGQLTVATALPDILTPISDTDRDDPDLPDPNKEEPVLVDGPIKRLAARPRRLKLSTKKIQWTLMFIREKSVVSIIGASDIDVSIIGASDIDVSLARAAPSTDDAAEQSSRSSCQLYSFRISTQTINLRRKGSVLIVEY